MPDQRRLCSFKAWYLSPWRDIATGKAVGFIHIQGNKGIYSTLTRTLALSHDCKSTRIPQQVLPKKIPSTDVQLSAPSVVTAVLKKRYCKNH